MMTRIKLITLGATLTAVGSDSLDLASYRKSTEPRRALSPLDLVKQVPEMGRFAQVEHDRDWGQDRTQPVSGGLWLEVARHIQGIFDSDTGVNGVVVVQGTNLLEEIAYFLHLVLKTDRPVVVVGAQRPFTGLSSDGPMNLVNAVRVAASPESMDRGVLVAVNERVHTARDVTKTSAYRLEAFQSPSTGPIGTIDADAVAFHFRPERLHTHRTPFDIRQITALPRVDIIYDHVGADDALVEAVVKVGARGLVVAGSGAGACMGMTGALEQAAAAGIAVVRSSRVGSGRVLEADNYAFPGSVAAGDLNPQKARILLQLALLVNNDPREIQKYFRFC